MIETHEDAESKISDEVVVTPTGSESAETLQARLEEEQEARRQITQRAKNAERELKDLKKQSQNFNNKTNQEPDEELIKKVNYLSEIESKRQFGFEHSLSPEETDAVFKFSNGKPTKEVLDNPFIKAGIESLRSQKRLESNTPGSSSRSSIYQGKQFSELSEDDRKKAFEEKMKGVRK